MNVIVLNAASVDRQHRGAGQWVCWPSGRQTLVMRNAGEHRNEAHMYFQLLPNMKK